MLGGFVGAVIAWFMYADEFKASEGVVDPIAQRNIFSTNPTTEGANYARNFFCEAICTFVFISAILAAASRAGENVLMLAICVGLIVWAVGMGMGGITGFAMNQARDLGPRMAYQVLPIKNKADNNWKYGLLVPGIAPFAQVNFPPRPRTCKKPPLRTSCGGGFLRPAECGGKLTCAVTCGNPGAFVQATQHIYLNFDGRGLLLLGALRRE